MTKTSEIVKEITTAVQSGRPANEIRISPRAAEFLRQEARKRGVPDLRVPPAVWRPKERGVMMDCMAVAAVAGKIAGRK